MSAADIERLTTPPAPPQRGPIPPDANYADPATNPALAFPKGSTSRSPVPPPGSDHSPDGVRLAVMAQDAVAKAPDTASGDEGRRKIYEENATQAASSTASAGEGTPKS